MSLSDFLYHIYNTCYCQCCLHIYIPLQINISSLPVQNQYISMSINTAITATSSIMIDAVTPLINPILVPVDTVVSVG